MVYAGDGQSKFTTGKSSKKDKAKRNAGEIKSSGKSYDKSFRNVVEIIEPVIGSLYSVFGGGGYEFTADVTGTGNGATGGTGLNEVTIIHNYLPYELSSVSDLGITVGCSGSGYRGWSGGVTGATYNEITYAHPDWSNSIISGSSFGAISLGDFFVLTGTSENDSRQCCYSCPATGY
tara:strand:- start:52204 stop:52734 length:531 start_codon:yes stop_codon:yes gene_type:complete